MPHGVRTVSYMMEKLTLLATDCPLPIWEFMRKIENGKKTSMIYNDTKEHVLEILCCFVHVYF